MEEYTLIQVKLSKEFDYKLNLHMVELKKMNVKTTKAELIAKFAEIGLKNEKL